MNQLYEHLFTYNPKKKAVTFYRNLTLAEADSDAFAKDAILGVIDAQDPATEVVLGMTFGGKIFQISQAQYGGKYIRESENAARFFDRGGVRIAIGQYLDKKQKLLDFRDRLELCPSDKKKLTKVDKTVYRQADKVQKMKSPTYKK